MKNENCPSSKPPTLEEFGLRTLTRLAGFYLDANPEKNEKNFEDEFINSMLADDNLSADNILSDVNKSIASNKPLNLKFAPIILSCAYCVQAIKAHKKNERELAWAYMVDANYWCGVTLAGQGLEAAREHTIHATRKYTAQKGGTARADKFKDLKEEVFKLARDKRPPEKGWRSRLAATNSIKAAVLAIAEEKKCALSAQQVEKTIYGWLKEMPDAKALFQHTKLDKQDNKVNNAQQTGAPTVEMPVAVIQTTEDLPLPE